jgi:hypothetical protein
LKNRTWDDYDPNCRQEISSIVRLRILLLGNPLEDVEVYKKIIRSDPDKALQLTTYVLSVVLNHIKHLGTQ